MTTPRNISGSEVNAFQTCMARYRYEYVYDLEPIRTPGPLAVGILGHECLEQYYKAKKDGKTFDEAKDAAMDYLASALRTGETEMETAGKVAQCLANYWAHYGYEPENEVVEIETAYNIDLKPGEFTMPLRIDLLMRNPKGELFLRDAKFCYNFWDQIGHDLNPQFAKYLAALRLNGVPVVYAELDEIRTRQVKDPNELLKRTRYAASNHKTNMILRDHIVVSERIMAFRALSEDEQVVMGSRCLNKMICKWCSYQEICKTELDGGPVDVVIASGFQKKQKYGYNRETTDLEQL